MPTQIQWALVVVLLVVVIVTSRWERSVQIPAGTEGHRRWEDRTTFVSLWKVARAAWANPNGRALPSAELARLAADRAEAFLDAADERDRLGWPRRKPSRLDIIAPLAFGAIFLLDPHPFWAALVVLNSPWHLVWPGQERRRVEAVRPRVLESLAANRRVLKQSVEAGGSAG